jgi:hypothetical protein
MTASPMNFSTVPLWRSSSLRTRVWYGCRTRRTSSGSIASARAVKPTRSQKRHVTTFRSSRAAVGAANAVPQAEQKRASAAFSRPQLGQIFTRGG